MRAATISDIPLSNCFPRGTESKTRLLQGPSQNPLSFGLSPLQAHAFHLFLPALVPSSLSFLSLWARSVLSPEGPRLVVPGLGLEWGSALELGNQAGFQAAPLRILTPKA